MPTKRENEQPHQEGVYSAGRLHRIAVGGNGTMKIMITKKSAGYLILTGLVCLGLIIELGFLTKNIATASQARDNWGLKFHVEGEQPAGNADQEFLQQYDAYFVGGEEEKAIYLTFDAGYENGCTEKILDVLKEQEVPATFFLVGHYIETNPELVKRMQQEGHIVGNHTYSHPDMAKIATKEKLQEELEKNEQVCLEKTGQPMSKYYRPPQGKYSESNLRDAHELGYTTVFWSLAYVDWLNDDQPTKEEAFSKLLPRVHPGCVLLLHSTSQTNAQIIEELITTYKEMGYTFKSLDDLTGKATAEEKKENGFLKLFEQ